MTADTATRTFLGFDYGLKRIGVAVGQEFTRTASSLTTLSNIGRKPDWTAIDRLVDEWRADAFVVGLPLNMDGTEQELSRAARKFKNQLADRYGKPVHLMDERLSSIEAEHIILAERGKLRKQNVKEVDKIAARLILQSWLEQNC